MKNHLKKTCLLFVSICAGILYAPTTAFAFDGDPSVVLSNPVVSAITTVTVKFTLDGDWPDDGTFTLVMAGFNTSGVDNDTEISITSGGTGGFTAVDGFSNNGTITATRDGVGTTTITGTDIVLTITGVVNPANAGPTTTFPVTVQGSTAGLAPSLTIATPLQLGGGPNHGQFCVINSTNSKSLPYFLAFFFALTALGIRTGARSKTV